MLIVTEIKGAGKTLMITVMEKHGFLARHILRIRPKTTVYRRRDGWWYDNATQRGALKEVGDFLNMTLKNSHEQ